MTVFGTLRCDSGQGSRLLTVKSGQDSFAGGLQSEGQRFAGNAVHKRADQPAQAGGNSACERGDFALHVDAAVALYDSPPGLHAPEVAAIVAGIFSFSLDLPAFSTSAMRRAELRLCARSGASRK